MPPGLVLRSADHQETENLVICILQKSTFDLGAMRAANAQKHQDECNAMQAKFNATLPLHQTRQEFVSADFVAITVDKGLIADRHNFPFMVSAVCTNAASDDNRRMHSEIVSECMSRHVSVEVSSVKKSFLVLQTQACSHSRGAYTEKGP